MNKKMWTHLVTFFEFLYWQWMKCVGPLTPVIARSNSTTLPLTVFGVSSMIVGRGRIVIPHGILFLPSYFSHNTEAEKK